MSFCYFTAPRSIFKNYCSSTPVLRLLLNGNVVKMLNLPNFVIKRNKKSEIYSKLPLNGRGKFKIHAKLLSEGREKVKFPKLAVRGRRKCEVHPNLLSADDKNVKSTQSCSKRGQKMRNSWGNGQKCPAKSFFKVPRAQPNNCAKFQMCPCPCNTTTHHYKSRSLSHVR